MTQLREPTTPITSAGEKFRTFGEHGPTYEVVELITDRLLRVRVVETGEELEYPLDQALADPTAK